MTRRHHLAKQLADHDGYPNTCGSLERVDVVLEALHRMGVQLPADLLPLKIAQDAISAPPASETGSGRYEVAETQFRASHGLRSGFFANLTDEQKAAALAYRGEDGLGNASLPSASVAASSGDRS